MSQAKKIINSYEGSFTYDVPTFIGVGTE